MKKATIKPSERARRRNSAAGSADFAAKLMTQGRELLRPLEQDEAQHLQEFLRRARTFLQEAEQMVLKLTPLLHTKDGMECAGWLGGSTVFWVAALEKPDSPQSLEFLDRAWRGLGYCDALFKSAKETIGSGKTGAVFSSEGNGAALRRALLAGEATGSIRTLAKEFQLSERQVIRIRNELKAPTNGR